jgi:hypothetical protein
MTARRARKFLLALGLGIVLAAVLAEVGVLLVFGEQPKFPRHVVGAPWGLRINEPGSSYRHKSRDVNVRFAINGQGLRAERDYPYEKPPGTQRILCLGDSFTVGYEVSFAECYASVMEKGLQAAGQKVEVLNAGVSGFSTAEECIYLERELHKYAPDVVVVGFFKNDYADNVRTGLFDLHGDELVERNSTYVPAGGLGDFLNRNWFFSLLSERSNAFAMLKEQITRRMKHEMEDAQIDRTAPGNVSDEPAGADAHAGAGIAPVAGVSTYERMLAAAIFDRLWRWTQEREIELVILSIPFTDGTGSTMLHDQFPRSEFALERPGLYYLSVKELLDPYVEKELLYWKYSHSHWTPLSHAVAGQALARLILERGLLR